MVRPLWHIDIVGECRVERVDQFTVRQCVGNRFGIQAIAERTTMLKAIDDHASPELRRSFSAAS